MKKTNVARRLISLLLLLTMLFGILPPNAFAEQVKKEAGTKTADAQEIAVTSVEEAQTRGYFDVATVPLYDDCLSMQGLAVLGDYVYTLKRNAGETKAAIFRTHRLDGTTEQMSIGGAMTAAYLGHGNDMCAAQVGNDSYLFVTTMKTSVDALVCFKISGTALTLVDILDVRTGGGSNITCSGLDVYEVNGTVVTLLVGHGSLIFLGNLDVTAPADLYCPLGFEIDTSNMLQVAREACGFSELEITVQGAAYHNDTYYMPVTLHHNNETQIKADNHSDSTSVIVAFPNIRDAIQVENCSVKASLAESIYIPDSGEMFFELESMGFAEGILYFNTNRVRIEDSITTVSVLLDPEVDLQMFNRRAAFSQDGIYRLSGAGATNYFLYDPGDGTPITAGIYSDIINTRFGFESNDEGFYYIRSMLTQEYLTVNADCTVTTGAKKENDPSQLFCLTQVNWPNEPGHVAIISMLNYQYLNNAADTKNLITTTGGKTFRLSKVKYISALENYLFDLQLYNACYPETVGMTREQGIAHFKSTGLAEGRIASVFFDPVYYMENNPDLGLQTYQDAYDHFLNYGFWEGRQGSLFFSCNEYLHSGNYNLKKGHYPDKYFYLKHFRENGANESLTRSDRYGSDEFAVQEVVAKYALTTTGGYDFLVEYISRNVRAADIRTADVQSREDLEELLFDWQYYSSKYSAALSEDKLAGFAGDTYAEKLYSHWIRYGISEGRTASPYFNAAFYRTQYADVPATNADAYEHFVTVGFWEGRAGSSFYDGESYLYGLNPERSLLCDHQLTVTATKDSSCTSNGKKVTYCCLCSEATKTVTLPALEHTDADLDSFCDDCGIILSGSTLIKSNIDTMVDPVPTNEFYDLSGKTFDNTEVEGTYYMVQHNADGVYRIFDTLNQSGKGSFPATTVTVKNNAVYGAHPDMAITLNFVEPGDNQDGVWYIGMNGDYWLTYGASTSETNYTVGEAQRATSPGRLALRMVTELDTGIFRIYRRINSKDHWINLAEKDGFYYYRFIANTTASRDNTFYIYKLLTDRLHTEDMYATVKSARALVDPNSLYDSVSYSKFLSCLKECIALYEKYNGTVLTGSDLANRDALQEAFDAKERELLDLMGILRINAEGKRIRYFPANMYNYNEDNMNALVNVLPGADTAGFFFESANNKNTSAFYSNYDSSTQELVKERTIRSQMYSITSGIAASVLSEASNPPFANSVVTADFWSTTPIENAKEVYIDVGVPFVYEDGYYILNSDSNAVFFEGEPQSGINLAILEKPASYYWPGGMAHGNARQGYDANDYTTFHYADGYVTGFQPFAKMTSRSAAAYTAASSVFEESELVESYLLDGVAFNSATNPTLAVSGSGTAVWGFGMKLAVDFKMTDDGRLMDDNNTPITFEFSGDDDVWVYIDDELVLDIGGSHDAIQGVIDFTSGNVIVRSDKYDRIRDKNKNGYGWSDSGKYDPEHLSSVHSIVTNQMYQKNIYTEVFNQTIQQFANNGETHTLTVYYMDRGKGRTNSMIKFNLPQTDTITVNKEVKCATYENGVLTEMTENEAAGLMSDLSGRSFEYTLTDNDTAMANQSYQLLENGVKLGESVTDANGKFTLKHGQSAVFSGLNFTASNKYKVVETPVTDTWLNVEWTYSTTGSAPVNAKTPAVDPKTYNENSSSTVTIDGELYGNETITFNCTNTFVVVNSEADEVIVDYGKPIQVDILQNDSSLLFLNGYMRQLQGFADYTENLNLITGLKTEGKATYTTESGDFSIENGQVLFTPKKLLDAVEQLYCVVKYSKGTDFFYLYEELRVVPSNVMYYETDFGDGIFATEANRDFVFIDFGPDDTTTWEGSNRVTVTKDTERGLLTGEITGGDPYISMEDGTKQLNYVTKPGDVIVMRAKTTRTSVGGNSTGYEVFLSFEDTTTSHGWEMIRDSSHEQGTGVFEVLTLAIPDEMIGRTLEEFRFDPFWNADGNKVLGTYELDYVYIGSPATAPSSDYLFFDFTNDTEDGLRYQQEQYGGFNGDVDPWSANTTDRNSELHEGEDPGTKAVTAVYDASACYIRSSEDGSSPYVLNHKVNAADQLQIRFKLKNFVTTGKSPSIGVTGYQNGRIDATVSGKDEGITIGTTIFSTTAFDSGEYITVTVPFNANYLTLSKLSTFCVFFNQMSSVSETELGEITIDYVYIGTAADFTKALLYNRTDWTTYSDVTAMEPAGDDEGNLFFDFTNDAEDQARYTQAQYGGLGINYDTTGWSLRSYTMDNLKFFNNTGVLHGVAKTGQAADKKYYYYFQSSQSLEDGFSLQYDPSNAEVIYVRAKLENFTVHGTPECVATYYTGTTKDDTHYYVSDRFSIDPVFLETGEYFVVRISAEELREHETITALRINFSGIDNTMTEAGRIYLDYVYAGTEAGYRNAMLHSRGETNPDVPQDSGLINDDAYLLLDFNEGDKTVWNYLNGTTVTKDTASGVLRGRLSTNGTADNWFGMRSDSRQINYTFKKGDVFQVRIKINLDDPSLKRTGFQYYFTNSHDGTYYEYKDNYYDHITGEYSVVTMTVPEHFWGMNVVNFRLDPFLGQATGTYELDYVYIGQPKQAPGFSEGQKDFILFTFDGDDLAQVRSRQSVYGGFDGENEPWTTNANKNTGLSSGTEKGTKVVTAYPGFNTYYIRSSTEANGNYCLQHKPNATDVLQMRFKLEDFEPNGTKVPYVALVVNPAANNTDPFESGRQYLSTDVLDSGEYITVTIPMNSRYAALDNIYTVVPHFNEMCAKSADQPGKITIDYIYLGPEKSAPGEGKMVLGYDSSYEDDPYYSNGSSLYTEGVGIPGVNADKTLKDGSYNGASFTFTGTGFDLLSRTGAQQGALRIMIYKADGTFERSATVINKSDKNLELYQIPVYSVNNLTFGTYTVRIFVNEAYDYGNDGNADMFGGGLDRGGEFYFDAVRIYNPINTSAAARANNASSRLAYEAYLSVSEADPKLTEVRQFLLDTGNFKGDGEVEGMLYLDNTDQKVSIGTYETMGPNNETYLAANQGIAFKIVVDGMIPDSIDLSAKSANGGTAMMQLSASQTPPSGFAAGQLVGITSATLQNYTIKIPAAAWNSNGTTSFTYVTVYNTGSGILSIADIKCAYASVKLSAAGRSIRFLVDAKMVNAMLPSVPTEDATLIFGSSLDLGNDLTMRFRVREDLLTDYDISTAYLVVERDVYATGAAAATVQTTTVTDYTVADGRLIFAYPGISAAQMNDAIRATLHVKDADGKEYVSPVLNTSVAAYLDALLQAYASDTNLLSLVMDMVNYGTAAQIYYDRHADAPVKEAFESFQTYAGYASADLKTALEDLSGTISNGNASATITQGLDLSTRVGITYKVTLPADVNAADARLVVKDAEGNELESFDLSSGTVDSKGRYCVTFFGSTSRDMRRVVCATVMAEGEAISDTCTYSISSYAHAIANTPGMPEALVNLTRLMVIYGDSAEAYFA